MANSGIIWTLGDNLLLKIDPSAGTLTQPATIDLDELANISITASGGAVAVLAITSPIYPVRIPKKYPRVNLSTNQFEVLLRLDRPILFGETVTVDIPAALMSDGTRTNASATGISITNKSYEVDGLNPNALLDASCRITYLDPTNGDDTLAAAVNSGNGYYVKADVGSNAAEPSITVQPYKTWYAAYTKARNSTAGSVLARHGCVLVKRGEIIDGESAGQYFDTSRVFGATGGTAYATPFVVGQYGTTGTNPEIQGEDPAGAGANSPVAISGGSSASYVVMLGVDLRCGSAGTALSIASNGGAAREGYFFKRCKMIGEVYWGSSASNFTQTYNGFRDCVFDGNNKTGSGGIWKSDVNWPDFQYRNVDARGCVWTNASQGGLYHGLYVKNMGNIDISECFFYDLGGAAVKLDTAWGAHISNSIFTACNSIGNNDCNGSPSSNPALDRDKDDQTTEYPTALATEGVYSRWVTWERNIFTDANASGTRGSVGNSLIGELGPSIDCQVIDNLGVFNAANQVSAFGKDDSPGSASGNVRDTWDFEVKRNTVVAYGTSASATTGFGLNPADNDSFTTDEYVGMHDLRISNNILAFGPNRSTVTPFRFGADVSDQDYSTSFTAGRSQLDADYNCFFASVGYTNAFRNGASTDLFSTIAALEADMNGTDTSMTGNRTEDPSIVDPTYEVSDYLVDTLGYTDLADAMSDLVDTVLTGSFPTGFDPETIASYVLPKYAHSLDTGDYNSETMGFEPWVAGAEPDPDGPLLVTDTANESLGDPIALTATQNAEKTYTFKITADGENITGLSFAGDGGAEVFGTIPIALTDGASTNIRVQFDTSTVDADQEQTITISYDQGSDIVVTFSLTVTDAVVVSSRSRDRGRLR